MNELKILDGKKLRDKVLAKITAELVQVNASSDQFSEPPRIDVIIVDGDPSSEKYVEMKVKSANSIGFKSVVHRFNSSATTKELVAKVEELNQYQPVTGFFIQLPLPKQIDTDHILQSIAPEKDVDGLNPTNLGKAFHGDGDAILSATPRGILMLLDEYNVEVEGKDVVIVGWSKIVGMPLLAELTGRGATVTVCHDKSVDIKSKTLNADILISATGVAGLIDASYVKEGAVVIDVGITVSEDGMIKGDVEFDSVVEKVSLITPVPGGVGPMTVAALMLNTFEQWKKSH